MFLLGVGKESLSGTIPETVFFMFQMTFAIITPALIVGAYVERIGFAFVLAFSALWLLIVYAPVTHWVWGGGWLAEMGVMDFAGGIVVHTTAGVSALVLAYMLGGRNGFPRELRPPHSPGLTMIGASMLWVGWFGFNAGSALGANGDAGMAMVVTHISAATASLVWAGYEWIKHGKPSLVGMVTGMVAGLATITPASGFVGPIGAIILGASSGLICQWAIGWIKYTFKIDDSLDVFAVHGVGGILGSLMVAVLCLESLGGSGFAADGMTIGSQLGVQAIGIVSTALLSGIVTVALVLVLRTVCTFRVDRDMELEGLDINQHGEQAYSL